MTPTLRRENPKSNNPSPPIIFVTSVINNF